MTAHQDDMHDAALHFNRPSHPTFARGHCFMVETLNRPEVESVGPIVAAEILRLEAEGEDARHLRRALGKMDYPAPAARVVFKFAPGDYVTDAKGNSVEILETLQRGGGESTGAEKSVSYGRKRQANGRAINWNPLSRVI